MDHQKYLYLTVCFIALCFHDVTSSEAGARIKNSKFKNPTEDVEKIINSKFEHPLEVKESDVPIDTETEFTNSKFKNPTELEDAKANNSKFEDPTWLKTGSDLRRFELTREKETKIKNSKFKHPDDSDEDSNSKFLNPNLDLDLKSIQTIKRINITGNNKSGSQITSTKQSSPFVFLLPSAEGKDVGTQKGAFAFLHHGILRPLFSIGSGTTDGYGPLNAYNARPLSPFSYISKQKPLFNFFATAPQSNDYPFAYRKYGVEKKKSEKV